MIGKIMRRLDQEGFEVYLVGGRVRDRLLGRETLDYDLATSARPEELGQIFKDLDPDLSGARFGAVKIKSGQASYELTTFRKEGAYRDGRHPGEISYTGDILEDLKRRDFTINAMAFNKKGLTDPYDGRGDLEKRLIRSVGDPFVKISEDSLRSLRAVRFATSLNFDLEENLAEAIRENAPKLKALSPARKREEVEKILLSENPAGGISLLHDLGLLPYIFPEVEEMVGFDQHSTFHKLDLFDHSLSVLEKVGPDLSLRYAALYHDTGKVQTFFLDADGQGRFFGHADLSASLLEKRLKVLEYPKKFIETTRILVERHMDNSNPYTKKSLRKLLRRLGEENLFKLLDLQKSDLLSTNYKDISNITRAYDLLGEINEERLPKSEKDLAFDGNDLKAMGFVEGKKLGEVLREVRGLVFDGLLPNDKQEIENFIKNTYL